MAEPTIVTKVTVTALLGGLVGAQVAPLMIDWGGVCVGSGLGAAICVSYAPQMSIAASARLFALSFGVGLVATWAAEAVLGAIFGATMTGAAESFRPCIALGIARYWREIVEGVPSWIKSKVGGGAP